MKQRMAIAAGGALFCLLAILNSGGYRYGIGDQAFYLPAVVQHLNPALFPRDRALLWLAYVEGESHDEIATSLGVRRRGVRVMLFRARRRLRDLLQARGILVNS